MHCIRPAARAAAAGTRAAVAGHQLQIALEEAVDRLVGISGHAGNEQHMRVVDGGVRTLADIPADDEIDARDLSPPATFSWSVSSNVTVSFLMGLISSMV